MAINKQIEETQQVRKPMAAAAAAAAGEGGRGEDHVERGSGRERR